MGFVRVELVTVVFCMVLCWYVSEGSFVWWCVIIFACCILFLCAVLGFGFSYVFVVCLVFLRDLCVGVLRVFVLCFVCFVFMCAHCVAYFVFVCAHHVAIYVGSACGLLCVCAFPARCILCVRGALCLF